MALTNEEALKQGDALYERYAKHLEAEHWGEFVAIAPDGRTIVGTEKANVQDNALRVFGEGVKVFKIGPEEVPRMRSPVKAIIVSKVAGSARSNEEIWDDVDVFYARYGKPLESEHWGKVVAIAPDGRTLLGTDVSQVEDEACDTLGDCFILFKVGLMSVGRI